MLALGIAHPLLHILRILEPQRGLVSPCLLIGPVPCRLSCPLSVYRLSDLFAAGLPCLRPLRVAMGIFGSATLTKYSCMYVCACELIHFVFQRALCSAWP